ncbi:putative hemolysin [Lachnospiraceae bacterium C7]|nr:putative hemolysin [Lachnospiraceae bacterium C7]
MDDGGSPYTICLVLGVIILLLLAVLTFLIYEFHDEIKKRINKSKHGIPFHDNDDVTEEEIISMVNEGHEQGVLHAQEAEMIHNIFEFDDKEAKDIMTHRANIIAVDGNMSFVDAIDFMIDCSRSRIPVYDGDIDNIIGVLHIKDALLFFQKNEVFRSAIKDIDGLVTDAKFIPETRKINALFKKMQSEKIHMVVVIDEYGQTSGIVAMEDILEEIVGNIEDEHDDEEKLIEKVANDTYVMDGMTPLDDVIDILDIPMEETEFDTLNGLLVSLLDKVPRDGESFSIDAYGFRFFVTLIKDKMIKKVRVTKLDKAS